jgi:hypothetical protein
VSGCTISALPRSDSSSETGRSNATPWRGRPPEPCVTGGTTRVLGFPWSTPSAPEPSSPSRRHLSGCHRRRSQAERVRSRHAARATFSAAATIPTRTVDSAQTGSHARISGALDSTTPTPTNGRARASVSVDLRSTSACRSCTTASPISRCWARSASSVSCDPRRAEVLARSSARPRRSSSMSLFNCSILDAVDPVGDETLPLAVTVAVATSVALAVDLVVVTERTGQGSHGVQRMNRLPPARAARRSGPVTAARARNEAAGDTAMAPTTATKVPVHRVMSAASVMRHE